MKDLFHSPPWVVYTVPREALDGEPRRKRNAGAACTTFPDAAAEHGVKSLSLHGYAQMAF